MRTPLPPVALAVRFIDCVNRCDVAGLTALMTDDHSLEIFGEKPLVGRDGNTAAWQGYFTSFPDYVIYPHRLAEVAPATVAILGHTTGSHLGLPDDAEARQTLIWLADTADDASSAGRWSKTRRTTAGGTAWTAASCT